MFDLGDHRALEELRRILRLLTLLKVVLVLPPPMRDPTLLSLLLFGRLRVLELRGCDLSTSVDTVKGKEDEEEREREEREGRRKCVFFFLFFL